MGIMLNTYTHVGWVMYTDHNCTFSRSCTKMNDINTHGAIYDNYHVTCGSCTMMKMILTLAGSRTEVSCMEGVVEELVELVSSSTFCSSSSTAAQHTPHMAQCIAASPAPSLVSGKGIYLESRRPGFDPCRFPHGDFSGSSHTSDFKIGTPVLTLPGVWCYRVSAGTGQPGVSDWVS